MAEDKGPWTLTIPSDPRLLTLARQFVEAICHVGGVPQTDTEAIVLALHEAVHNVIRHAHRGDARAELQIRCHLQVDAVEIHLLDEGQPFDLANVPELDPAELRLGGRGVFLMRRLMDELTCHPREDRGNLLRMLKRCSRRGLLREGA